MNKIVKSNNCVNFECKKVKAKVCYLAVLPFEQHLCTIFTEKWSQICRFFYRKHTEDTIENIDDGTLMKQLKQEGYLFPNMLDSFLCCDGASVFQSSGQTLWPVLMFTTSLPPMIRMNSENMMVGALWLGPCKPPMEALGYSIK
ncbi:hypothetical protein EMCRGX_G017363 [Ephydatia muelleri]